MNTEAHLRNTQYTLLTAEVRERGVTERAAPRPHPKLTTILKYHMSAAAVSLQARRCSFFGTWGSHRRLSRWPGPARQGSGVVPHPPHIGEAV